MKVCNKIIKINHIFFFPTFLSFLKTLLLILLFKCRIYYPFYECSFDWYVERNAIGYYDKVDIELLDIENFFLSYFYFSYY